MIKTESTLNYLEVALNEHLASVLGVARGESTLGSIPYGLWVFNAIVSVAPDKTGTDPVYRVQGLECVVTLFGRFEVDYLGARKRLLNASETITDELLKLRATGITNSNLNQAFRGLTIRDVPINHTAINADNKAFECVVTATFSATYQYDDFADNDPLWQ